MPQGSIACLLAMLGLVLLPGRTAGAQTLEEKIADLQAQLDALRAELAEQAPAPAEASPATETSASPRRWRVDLGGQYRVNAYSVDDGVGHEQTAARLRIRQNLDLTFDERFATHLQLELGHVTGNVGTTGRGTLGPDNPGTGEVRVRHALLSWTTHRELRLTAGLVPAGDRFADMLFSSDWDYSPLTLGLESPVGAGSVRLFVATLSEGLESLKDDDARHVQADFEWPVGEGRFGFGASWLERPDSFSAVAETGDHLNYGFSFEHPVGSFTLSAALLASRTDGELLGRPARGSGVLGRLELRGKAGPGEIGLLLTHATGEDDGDGFLPLMSLVGANGYWGYTGLLTVQGPTDTGFDGDAINVSNNGHGLSSVQLRYRFPVSDGFSAVAAAGWFGNTEAGDRDGTIGLDGLLMGTHRFNDVLALDMGLAYASLGDSVSGYWRGAAGGFNQDAGVDRGKRAVFLRLQAEW